MPNILNWGFKSFTGWKVYYQTPVPRVGGFLLKGIILRGYSSFYYVLVEDKEYECSLRGKYRVKAGFYLVIMS